ncbi:MAG: hypothetical protein JXB38_02640 [Anaerolineales bacterium]|nr:hypothetical protein [Anaerolineales bacterium]
MQIEEILIRCNTSLPLPEITVVSGASRRTFFTTPGDLRRVLLENLHEAIPELVYLPPGLLYTDLQTTAVWWRPPTIQRIAVEFTARKAEILPVPLPGLLMNINADGERMVCAIKGSTRPQPDDPIWYAPLPNLNTSHRVCAAGGDQEKLAVAGLFDEQSLWEIYWESTFTAHSVTGKSHRYPDDIRLLLAEIAGQSEFPEADLKPANDSVAMFAGIK